MIRQVEKYHGVALARLLRSGRSDPISIGVHPDYRSAYVIEDVVAVYVKYSTNRLTPWTFAFRPEHQDEIDELCGELDETFIALVCGDDGVACLTSMEYRCVMHGESSATEWIRVSRRPRQRYAVSGSDGQRVCRIGNREYPAKVFTAMRVEES